MDPETAIQALVAADGNARLAADNLHRALNQASPTAQGALGQGGPAPQGGITVESLLLAVASSPSHTTQLLRALRLRNILHAHVVTGLAHMAAMTAIASSTQPGGLEPYQATKTYTNLLGELGQLTDPHESHQTMDVHNFAWEEVPAQFRDRILALRAASHQAPGAPAGALNTGQIIDGTARALPMPSPPVNAEPHLEAPADDLIHQLMNPELLVGVA